MLRQRTLREKASCTGVGLHCGRQIKLELLPAPEDHGITFIRTDLPRHPELRACIEHLAETTLATTLAVGGGAERASVGTVEHLLAALAGLGVDNARVLLDGPEVPILDGSAGPFVDLLLGAGIELQRRPKKYLVIKKEVRVRDGDKVAKIAPGSGTRITCSLDFDHPLIPPAPYRFEFSERAFQREVARARTFGFLQDVEALRSRGLARGGSLDNAIVIDEYQVLNPEGLRFPDEFARHKLLDAIGDLSLFGMPVVGKVSLHRSGHALNTQLVKAVLDDPKSHDIVVPVPEQLGSVGHEGRAFELFEAIKSIA
ncbi:MAG TPA: UDP-3-O-acyl-N-acetylglucosamine deacetylase [Myxococcota bacterium]|nr:UDP-3-O-acyl-N-acetylglucosamine deacetylase [Myxococcota bacterium]